MDTDDSCRLLLDGQDQGVVKPDETKKITVKFGEHILKCTVEGIPDLVWRKVIEVKNSEQVAALIELKTLHAQAASIAKEYHAGDNRSTHGWMDTVGALAAGVTAAYGGTPVPASTSTEPQDGNSGDVPDAQTGQGLQLHDTCLIRDPRPWNPHTAGTVAALYMRNTCNIALTVAFCFKEPDAACWKCDTIAPGPGQSDTPTSLPAGCRTTNCSELQIVYHAVSEGSPPKPNVDDSCVGAVH